MAEKWVHDGVGHRLAGIGWAFALAALVGCNPANAQGLFDFLSGVASTTTIQQTVARSGYALRSAIVRRGDIYVCDAADGAGRIARLVLDAHSAALIRAYATGRSEAPLPRDVTRQERSRETTRTDEARARTPADDWGYAPRPPVEVPVYRPYQGLFANVGPQVGGHVPDQVPQPRLVARGPSTFSDMPAPVETKPADKPKPHPVKASAPPNLSPTNPANSAAATPSGTTIVVPASTLPPSAAEAPPTVAATPKTVEAEAVGAQPNAPAAPAPAPKASINDIPVAPLD